MHGHYNFGVDMKAQLTVADELSEIVGREIREVSHAQCPLGLDAGYRGMRRGG